jgi:hypothetical protein
MRCPKCGFTHIRKDRKEEREAKSHLCNPYFGSAYGVAGSSVIVITWVYYSAHISLMKAEFTQVSGVGAGTMVAPTSSVDCRRSDWGR